MPADVTAEIPYDVAVVGGGINGTGIARDLAGRGARVVMFEQHDLAQHTSSASTKLIHGGLRYLEHHDFGLVKKALGEREVLLRGAPHIMWPLRFVMPHDRSMRPAWMIRLGLFLYDHLAKRRVLPGSCGLDLRRDPAGAPLKRAYTRGFEYSDGWVDDARLVTLCAVDAAARGAAVHTRTTVVDAARHADHWVLAHRGPDGVERRTRARLVVNAAGPWAAAFLGDAAHSGSQRHLRLVKGSHIVVPRLHDHERAYILQSPDGRIVFAIPYEGRYTLIGTTDVEQHGPIGEARCSDEEIAYLCAQASRYFAKPVRPDDVVWTYSGVRPLLDDEHGNPAAVTRDYRLEVEHGKGAPILTVWGGKITTFRKLAEEAGDRIAELAAAGVLGQGRKTLGPAWTESAYLAGGDLRAALGADAPPADDVTGTFERFRALLASRAPAWPAPLVHRLARAYGTVALTLAERGLGAEIAPGLHEAELQHLVDHEWARSADDVLWRRSKLGLHLDNAAKTAVAAWFAARSTSMTTATPAVTAPTTPSPSASAPAPATRADAMPPPAARG